MAALSELGVPPVYEAEPINRRWDEVPASVSLPLVYDATARVVAGGR